jgi:hypothetical protein
LSIFGIDYAWGRPGPAALHDAKVGFVCRYLSHDPPKNLSRAEAALLSDSGIWLAVVWETAASRALSGQAGGVADAKEAAKQAAACGMPGNRPIYFAVDWDASAAQQAAINAYLDGAASVLGRDRVGLYAGYGPIKRAFDAKKITYGWQTYAWSGGRWDARAHLQQYSNGHTLNGVGVDYNRAMKADYGQWRVGGTPIGGDDMPEPKDLWNWDGIAAPPWVADANKNWTPASYLHWQYRNLANANAKLDAILKASGQKVDVDESAIVAGVLAGLSPASIAQAVKDALPADLAGQVVDELKTRLEA